MSKIVNRHGNLLNYSYTDVHSCLRKRESAELQLDTCVPSYLQKPAVAELLLDAAVSTHPQKRHFIELYLDKHINTFTHNCTVEDTYPQSTLSPQT